MTLDDIEQEIRNVGQPTETLGIRVLEGSQPGPNVGLMGMLHGNEHAGMGLWDVARQLGTPARGRLYLIVGHPEALYQTGGSVRSLKFDINRLFSDDLLSDDHSRSADHARCLDLQSFLPKLDILIDIHSTSACTEPFVIVPERPCNNLKLALRLPITQLFGIDRFLARTATSWLTGRGRTGVTIEVGQHDDPASRDIAADIVYRILDQLHMIRADATMAVKDLHYTKRLIGILEQIRVEGTAFEFLRHSRNFEALTPGEIIAQDTCRQYQAPKIENLVLCMPTAIELLHDNIGSEAFYVGIDLSFLSNVLVDVAAPHC